jgi:uncharacterized protein DUF1353
MQASRFSMEPVIQLLRDGHLARIWVTFVFTRSNGESVVVEKDFLCDGGSIPWFLWGIVGSPFTGRCRNAYLVHDWLYKNGIVMAIDGSRRRITRAEADLIFYEAARCGHATWFSRWSKYRGVRLGSSKAWRHAPLPGEA